MNDIFDEDCFTVDIIRTTLIVCCCDVGAPGLPCSDNEGAAEICSRSLDAEP